MTASTSSTPTTPPYAMDRAAVLSALATHCGADPALARRLQTRLGGLLDEPLTWARQAQQAGDGGLPTRYQQGRLAEVLALPGDLALLRLPDARARAEAEASLVRDLGAAREL